MLIIQLYKAAQEKIQNQNFSEDMGWERKDYLFVVEELEVSTVKQEVCAGWKIV